VEGERTEAGVVLSSHDWGAHGVLRVTAHLTDGRVILGKLEGATEPDVRLPKRTQSNAIADAYWSSHGLTAKADDTDDETGPTGDGHAGDGLSLFEEYRGFYVGRAGALRHLSTSPTRKDHFVVDRIRSDYSAEGISLFAYGSGLTVHDDFLPENVDYTRIANFNHGPPSLHAGTKRATVLGIQKLEHTGGKAVGGSSLRQCGLAAIWNTEAPQAVAHELGHCVSVLHHGDGDREKAQWERQQQADGSYFLTEDLGLITLRHENGSLVELSTYPERSPVYVAAWGGEHSGDESCFMRYATAAAYAHPSNPGDRFLSFYETQGSSMCLSREGTGVNAATRQPRPRYGPATRGDCVAQVCVNEDVHEGGPE
jgi:hypothetical protein